MKQLFIKSIKLFKGYNSLFIAICFALLWSVSCNINEHIPNESEQTFPVTFRIPLRNLSLQDGDGIEYIRVMICKTEDNKFFFNEKYTAEDMTESMIPDIYGTIDIELYPGMYDIIVLSNCYSLEEFLTGYDLSWQNVAELIISPKDFLPEKNIISEQDMYPFPRVAYLEKIRIGNIENASSQHQISIDRGNSWREDLPVELECIFPKMNISIRKMTLNEKDRIRIKSLNISPIPAYSYFIPQIYKSMDVNIFNWYPHENSTPGIDWFLTTNNNEGIDENMDTYIHESGDEKQVYVRYGSTNVILPEYLQNSHQNTPTLTVTYDYESWDKNSETWNHPIENITKEIPFSNTSKTDQPYDLNRNNEYHILLTITQTGEFEFNPYIIMEIDGWEEYSSGYFNAGNMDVYVEGEWINKTPDQSNFLYLDMYETIGYKFTFKRKNPNDKSIIRWKAVLSNPVDFCFEEGSTSGFIGSEDTYTIEGYARAGDTYILGISPAYISTESKSTKVHINIENGIGGSIQLPLDPEKEYVIRQNPL